MSQSTTQPSALELLREAMVAARTNDQVLTRRLLLEATRLDPSNETAWQWLAGVAATPLEATLAWERVLALSPEDDKARAAIRPVRLKAGITAAKAKDVTLARRLLKAAVSDDPGNEHGWLWLASVCETPQEGMAHLQRVLLINPGNATARKGIEYFQTKLKKTGTGPGMSGMTRMSGPASGIIRLADLAEAGIAAPAGAVKPTRTLLVIDTSRTTRKLVGLVATREGFKVSEAGSANAAIERLRELGAPDLIIIDPVLPGMDGYEFCRVIRQSSNMKKVPVVVLGGKEGLFDKLRGRVTGVDVFLPKPLRPDLLLRAVYMFCPPVAIV